jgi:hypothetical protein
MSAECGSEGRGFESRRSPFHLQVKCSSRRHPLKAVAPVAQLGSSAALARSTFKAALKDHEIGFAKRALPRSIGWKFSPARERVFSLAMLIGWMRNDE